MLSIEISNTFIYLVEGEFSKGRVQVQRFASIPTPEGSVKNGVIASMAELSLAIRECIEKNQFKSKRVVLTVNSSAVVTREVTVPAVSAKEMQTLLQGEINQVATAKQEYVIDYIILERTQEQGADVCRVMCIVIPRAVVSSYRDLVEKGLGLKAYSLDVGIHTIYKLAYLDSRIYNSSAAIIVSLSEDEIRLNLVEGRNKIFFRAAPVSVTRGVVESEYILSSISSSMVSEDIKREQIVSAAAENISKMVQFQSMKNKSAPVEHIYFVGDLSAEQGVSERITDLVGLRSEPLSMPDFVTSRDAVEFCKYAKAIAALIEL